MIGDKNQLAFVARALAGRGYAAFAVNYRLAPAHRFPAQIEDCRSAVRWMLANAKRFKVDADRLGAIGYSAGGQLVALLGAQGVDLGAKEAEKERVLTKENEEGEEVFYGTIQGRIKAKPCTLLRIETDDNSGFIKALLAEGEYTKDELNTFGGFGVIHISSLQKLLKQVCKGGYAHHVAVNFTHVAEIIEEAIETYLGWPLEKHHP